MFRCRLTASLLCVQVSFDSVSPVCLRVSFSSVSPVCLQVTFDSVSPVCVQVSFDSVSLVCLQVSFGSVSPVLSDKTIYPRFFRSCLPEIALNTARIDLMKKFSWTHAAIILQSRLVYDMVRHCAADGRRSTNTMVAAQSIVPLSEDQQEAVARKAGSVLRGTILNYKFFIGRYRGQPIQQPIKMT